MQRTDPAYEAVRRALVWNELKPERYPELIVHAASEADVVATPSRARGSFKPANWERLRAVRNAYDPDGLFHGFFAEA